MTQADCFLVPQIRNALLAEIDLAREFPTLARVWNNAIAEARKSLSGLMWFEVTEFRGAITDKGTEFQATVKMGFRLKD